MMAFLLRSFVLLPVCLWLLGLCCENATRSYAQETTHPVDASPFADDADDLAFDRDAKHLAMRLRSATPDQREALKAELKALNEKHFEYRQRRRKRELDELTAGVARLRNAYEQRQKQRADVLARRFSDLTDPNTNRGWDDIVDSARSPNQDSNAKISSARPDSTSTYNGVTLAQWLKTLEHERNHEKVADAVVALNHLVDQADPEEVLAAVMKLIVSEAKTPTDQYTYAIRCGAICLLLQLPRDIVGNAIQLFWEDDYASPEPRTLFSLTLAELASKTDEDSGIEFLARFPQARRSQLVAFQGMAGMATQKMFFLPSKQTMAPLQAEVKSLAPRLIQLLINAVEQNPAVRSAAVNDGKLVLQIARQSLTDFPEFVPIAEADLDDPKSNHSAAARLLAEVGLKAPQVLEFVNLQFTSINKNPSSLEETLRYLELLAPHTPEAVDVLVDRFRKECAKLIETMKSSDSNDILGKVRNQTDCCGQYILALARIGKPAERVIPELQKIVESTRTEAGGPIKVDSQWPWSYHRFWFDLTGDAKSPFTLQELSDAAIKVIQNSKPAAPPIVEARATNSVPQSNDPPRSATTIEPSDLARRRERAEAHLKQLDSQRITGGAFGEIRKQAEENVRLLKELEDLTAAKNALAAKPTTSSDEPTYKGVVLSDWMRTLKHERDRAKISDAVMAANFLVDQADPNQILQAILNVLKVESRYTNQDSFSTMIHDGSLLVLIRLPARLVVDQLAVEFNNSSTPTDPSKSVSLGRFRNSLSQLLKHLVVTGRTPIGYPGRRVQIFDPVTKLHLTFPESKESEDALRTEVRRRSRHLIRILANVSQNEPKLKAWAISAADPILLISQQPITTYPELIPIAEEVMEDSKAFSQITAAELLAESGLQTSKVMTCIRQAIERQPDQPNMGELLSDKLINAMILAANHSPDAVELLIDRLRSNPPEAPQQRNLQSVFALAAIRTPARPAIPFLKEMRNAKSAGNGSPYHPYFDRTELPQLAAVTKSGMGMGGGMMPSYATVRDTIDAAIKEIETDKPKPTIEPLPDDEAEEPQTPLSRGQTSPSILLGVGAAKNSTLSGAVVFDPDNQPTYDGTPYSDWIEILRKERKAAKLAQAIEAVARLAPLEDQKLITKEIFAAASLVERNPAPERAMVWNSSFNALRELPAQTVTDALIETLHEDRHPQHNYWFEGEFVAFFTDGELEKAMKPHAAAIASDLLRHAASNRDHNEALVAGALKLMHSNKIPIDQIPAAQELGIETIKKGPFKLLSSKQDSSRKDSPLGWFMVADAFVTLAPQTPGLPESLMKHIGASTEVLPAIGRLGHHARGLTPQLVELFQRASDNPVIGGRDNWRFPSAECVRIVKVLGQIGADGDGYRLLNECHNLQTPSVMTSSLFSNGEKAFFKIVDEALAKSTRPSSTEAKIPILSDEIRISGVWFLKDDPTAVMKLGFPGETPSKKITIYRRNGNGSFQELSTTADMWFSELQHATSIQIQSDNPKSLVSFGSPLGRKKWPYELTEKSLKLLIVSSEADTPPPDKFPSSDEPLPKGIEIHEFQREWPAPTDATPVR